VADDHDSWGKTTARTQGLVMRDKSPNGGVERWLAGSDGTAAAHLIIGEKVVEKGKLRLPSAFIARGEREGVTVALHIGDQALAACRSGSTMARAGFPYPGSLTGGPRSAFELVARVRKVFGSHCSWHDPLTIAFPFSHTEMNLEIMKSPLLVL
jgi:hypothetical protein